MRVAAKWAGRFALLYIAFIALFIIGTLPLASLLPADAPSEPGLVSPTVGLLLIAFANVAIVAALILTSRWRGWKLAISLAFVYYGTVTFLPQIESWYFLSSLTLGPGVLSRLFLMGVPTAFLFVPLAVWILGRRGPGPAATAGEREAFPAQQWIVRLAAIVVAYLILYWGAGYFIAWQNPELRGFYGHPGEAAAFFPHTFATLRDDPWLLPFQAVRALLWTLCALPVIIGSGENVWRTALLVGLLFAVPQNIGHIIANPLMPIASVRLSHMVETASSTFVFGLIVVLSAAAGWSRGGSSRRTAKL